ncbi:c-type cytochrome [Halarcobacter bivalviorum]|uniref:Monoheme c-type cytochrome n=1 Tax=Halarcobacter bivalviorum TaxID=663364 RepID=A0AAX2A8P9_9BACT|nr:hypothetical protein [Halarcobacter bivalviorum]AXH12839.1 monoheme c-type cytochrome [Halarcobacter bivalviorum]RXK09036.1 hypothetical protein CRV05_12215 [Halarcobacter bivalviorum]
MIKKILLLVALLLISSGCTEKKEKSTLIEKESELKIEIEENQNKEEIKVAQKEHVNKKNETYYFNYNGVKSEYDPNSKPANEDAAVRVTPRTNIEANLHIRSPYEQVQISLLVKKLSKEFIVKCSACHNDYANGIIGPSLLDKDADFIYNSILKFKNNKDANVLMTDLVKQMSDENIKKLANEIYEFNKEVRKIK